MPWFHKKIRKKIPITTCFHRLRFNSTDKPWKSLYDWIAETPQLKHKSDFPHNRPTPWISKIWGKFSKFEANSMQILTHIFGWHEEFTIKKSEIEIKSMRTSMKKNSMNPNLTNENKSDVPFFPCGCRSSHKQTVLTFFLSQSLSLRKSTDF